ncbi:MAG: TFIIB-type zinc ribbon-containing protein [Candidatus Aenigmatarchaeota archaeon]
MEEKPLLRARVEKCPECGSKNIIKDYDTGEDVCSNCGLVIAQKIYDKGPEWRAFDEEQREKRPRSGAPLTYTLHDMGLMTSISNLDRDAYGKPLKPQQKETSYRLRKWQTRMRVSDANERSLALGLDQIIKVSNKLELPKNAMENASLILRKALKERISRGRSLEGLAVASVYLSCRQLGIPRSIDQVSEISGLRKTEIGRSYRFIVKELGYILPPPSPGEYVSRPLNEAGKSGKTEDVAYKILLAAKQARLTLGKAPTGLAAAAAYIASVLTGERITQKDLAEKMRCTEVTIRNRYKELVERLMFIVEL